jgi:hypothetical protein
MAVWAIAWAGSKPLASLTDGLLASGISVKWGGISFKWNGIGIKWTGVALAAPAVMPVLVLIALAVVVVAVRKWKPPEERLAAQILETLANFALIKRAEELLVNAPEAEITKETPINA